MKVDEQPTKEDVNRVRAVILAIPDELPKSLPELNARL